MKTQLMIALIALLVPGVAISAQPTTEQIAEWFKRSGLSAYIRDSKGISDEKHLEWLDVKRKEFDAIDPERPVYDFDSSKAVEVKLRNRETAYLLEVDGPGGRNDSSRVLLLRPVIGRVCELKNPTIKFVVSVIDLDKDGVSEILAERIDSGQGSEVGTRYLMQLDGCAAVVLRSAIFENDEGAYGRQSHRYYRKDVEWSFVDIDGDETLDLNEKRIVEEGRNGRQPIVTKKLYRYLFKDNSFVRYVDGLQSQGNRK